MINHHITKEKIYIIDITGDFGIKDLEDFLDYFLTLPDLPKDLKLMYDLQQARATFSLPEIERIFKVADKARIHFSSLKTAILTNSEFETAISMIVKQHSSGKSREREIFSTYDAAMEWINR
jgi:hypothetical protein